MPDRSRAPIGEGPEHPPAADLSPDPQPPTHKTQRTGKRGPIAPIKAVTSKNIPRLCADPVRDLADCRGGVRQMPAAPMR